MARYKPIDTSPRFLAVDLQRQLLPGTFEHALNHLIDHEIDLSGFDARFKNDATGAAAYPPAMLLKVVLFAYSQGIISSRNIEAVCRDHVTFIALSGDSQPHFPATEGSALTERLGVKLCRKRIGRLDGTQRLQHGYDFRLLVLPCGRSAVVCRIDH